MTETTEPSTFKVEREINIAASAAAVYERIVDLHQWVDWSPWEGMDPDLHRTYGGPESGVGATYGWSGTRKVGSGAMTITEAVEPSAVVLDLDFIKPFKAHNVTRFALHQDGDSTQVTWTMTGAKTFMSKVMGIFMSMDKLVGRDFERGLAQLKTVVEG
jgi:hypothetical protein